MNFNFNRARVLCQKAGFRVHVIKALLNLRDREGITPNELNVIGKAVEYIKALEIEVARLERQPAKVKSIKVDIIQTSNNGAALAEANREFRKGLPEVMRLGLGKRS
jgi:DNA-binding transcriptional MerR regulator